jgi:hypothetical protein
LNDTLGTSLVAVTSLVLIFGVGCFSFSGKEHVMGIENYVAESFIMFTM